MQTPSDKKKQRADQEEIRILIVEDHPLFGQGLRRILDNEPGMRVVGEIADGADAVQQALILQPDVILMDVNLPSMNGMEATQTIKQESRGKDIGVIILTAYHDDEQLYYALQTGAAAYFPKDVLPSRLLVAIRAVAQGDFAIDEEIMDRPQVAAWLLRHLQPQIMDGDRLEDLFRPLTAREMEVMRAIVNGQSNKEVARSLNVSPQTVKNHMTNILRKLSVDDRTQAAVLALRRGWIRLDEAGQ